MPTLDVALYGDDEEFLMLMMTAAPIPDSIKQGMVIVPNRE